MSIRFPVVPNVPGVPALASFPGVAGIAGSISGNVLTITTGIDAVSQGLSLKGIGLDPATVLTSGLTSITSGIGAQITSGIGTAFVNIPQSVGSLAMDLTGSLDGLLPDVGDLLGGDTTDVQDSSGTSVHWGIFFDGQLVVEPDSIIALDYKKDWHESDYPIEGGTFESYNKVRVPYEVRVTMTKGGTDGDRAGFLRTLEDAADSLDLYDVVTPEYTYTNANITHIDYNRRADSGATLLTVVVWLQEIRIEASSEFTSTVSPTSVNQVNSGIVQTIAATQQQIQNFVSNIADRAW